jgi:hypothetical protein
MVHASPEETIHPDVCAQSGCPPSDALTNVSSRLVPADAVRAIESLRVTLQSGTLGQAQPTPVDTGGAVKEDRDDTPGNATSCTNQSSSPPTAGMALMSELP